MANEPSISITESNSDSIAANSFIVGNDRDEHGCIGSAGYVWSDVLFRCVRLFEEGVRFLPTGKLAQQQNSTENDVILLGFVIFEQPDSMNAELFFPHLPTKIICHKTSSSPDEQVWISGNYSVHKLSNSKYYITHFGETIYIKE